MIDDAEKHQWVHRDRLQIRRHCVGGGFKSRRRGYSDAILVDRRFNGRLQSHNCNQANFFENEDKEDENDCSAKT